MASRMSAVCSGLSGKASTASLGRDHVLTRDDVFDLAHHARLEPLPVADHGGQRRGHLQHREGVVALADAQRDGLAGVPLALLGPAVGLALPVGGRQDARDLALEVDAREPAEAERLHLARWIRSTPISLARVVEVDVARLDDGAAHVHRAAALVLRAAETVSAEDEHAVVHDDGLGPALARVERGQGHERLVGRARRVGAAQRSVEQRLVGAFVELFPVLAVDAIDEQVGVERGLGDESQHLAVARVDRHQRATAIAIKPLDQALQAGCRSTGAPCCLASRGSKRSRRTALPPALVSTSSKPVMPCSSRS